MFLHFVGLHFRTIVQKGMQKSNFSISPLPLWFGNFLWNTHPFTHAYLTTNLKFD